MVKAIPVIKYIVLLNIALICFIQIHCQWIIRLRLECSNLLITEHNVSESSYEGDRNGTRHRWGFISCKNHIGSRVYESSSWESFSRIRNSCISYFRDCNSCLSLSGIGYFRKYVYWLKIKRYCLIWNSS